MYEEAIEKVYAAKLEKGKAYVNVFGGEVSHICIHGFCLIADTGCWDVWLICCQAPKEMKEEAKEKQQAAEKV